MKTKEQRLAWQKVKHASHMYQRAVLRSSQESGWEEQVALAEQAFERAVEEYATLLSSSPISQVKG